MLKVTCESWLHFRNRSRFQNGFKIYDGSDSGLFWSCIFVPCICRRSINEFLFLLSYSTSNRISRGQIFTSRMRVRLRHNLKFTLLFH